MYESSLAVLESNLSHPPGYVATPGRYARMNGENKTAPTEILVENTGTRLVQIGSHYHFFEANPVLGFDRKIAYGMWLDKPPGTREHFPPGEVKSVNIVPIGGRQVVRSFYGVVEGDIDDYTPEEALQRLKSRVYQPLAAPPQSEKDRGSS